MCTELGERRGNVTLRFSKCIWRFYLVPLQSQSELYMWKVFHHEQDMFCSGTVDYCSTHDWHESLSFHEWNFFSFTESIGKKKCNILTSPCLMYCGCRADQHIPSYAKKLVSLYNKNGEIDKILKEGSKWFSGITENFIGLRCEYIYTYC